MASKRAQIDVINRILYLMEENSVVALTKKDPAFRNYMVDMYSNFVHKLDELDKPAPHRH